MGKLFIHAGMGKTGTSSIQASLFKNRDVLARYGVRSLESSRSDRADAAKHVLKWNQPRDREWKELRKEAVTCIREGGTLILSNETIWRQKPKEIRLLRKVFRGLEIVFLVYVREQVDFLESRALQAIKTGSKRWDLDVVNPQGDEGLEKYLEGFLPELDFLAMARRWGRVLGEGNVQARLYSRECFPNGNVLEDFYGAIGVSTEELDLRSEGNPSLSVPFAEICNHSEKYLPTDLWKKEIVDASLMLSKILTPVPVRILSPERSREIREQFAESNREFFERYVVNGTEFPIRDRPSGEKYDLDELAAEVRKVIETWPLLGYKGLGAKRAGSGFFADGWEVASKGPGFEARQVSPEASLRFRVPYQRHLRAGSDTYLLQLGCRGDSVKREIRFNGRDLGTFDLADGPVPFEASWLDQFGNAEIRISIPEGESAELTVVGLRVEDAEEPGEDTDVATTRAAGAFTGD